MTWRDRWFHARRRVREWFEDQWFDRTHHVRTAGDVSLRSAGIAKADEADSELYVPARPRHIRQALRAARLADASPYTFVDIGSGKGRTLFVAAEMPFRRVVGVEFSAALHEQACRNARTFRFRGQDGRRIEPLHRNAMDFELPEGPLVLYLFNPFGAATMQVVLDHLEESLASDPRHTIVILLWPRCGEQVARVSGMQRIACTERHDIFEAYSPGAWRTPQVKS